MGTAGPSASEGNPKRSARQIRATQEALRRLPLFAELAPADIGVLCRAARHRRFAAGEGVMQEGSSGDGLYVILEGQLEVTKREGSEELVLALRHPGEFLGEMALLESSTRTASVRAVTDAEVLVIAPDAFQSLLARSPSAATTILRTMAARLRSTEATLMQREKLASLGVLAAGLAHELNNPAAAIGRAAEHLGEAFALWRRRTAELERVGLRTGEVEALAALEAEIENCGEPSGDTLQCSRIEGELIDWLEARGVSEPWELATPLAAHLWALSRLRVLTERFPDAATFEVVLRWLAAGLDVQSILAEIGSSAKAISGIVRAVKTYAFLDQAPVQEVDVRDGLEDTLVMLRHKLREGVTVHREFEPGLPRIEAYASELNQVWTNLVDNAVQAMDGKGTLTLRTRRAGGWVEVEVEDDGPGIPPDVAPRVFDPFFTTKGPGVGSGLGLHIVYNIVADKHRGRITFESEPGRTVFRVALPERLKEGA